MEIQFSGIQNRHWRIGLTSALLCFVAFSWASAAVPPFTHRLVYTQSDLNKKGINSFLERMRTAASIGYNGIVPGGLWGFEYRDRQTAEYMANVQKAVAEAKKVGITLIPSHFSQASTSCDNPNLSEAFPVRGTPFLVSGTRAMSMNDSAGIGLKNGDFEEWSNGKPADWHTNSLPNTSYARDETVKRFGNASLKVFQTPAGARISQTIKVKPFRAYKISVWLKTETISNVYDVRFMVDGSQGLLCKRERPFGAPKNWSTVSPTRNWTESVTDFNSIKSTRATVALWFCYTKPQTGTIWVDGLKVEEVGLYETIRRETCPLVVRSQDGSKTYVENTDYIVDPKCNNFDDDSYWYQGHLTIPAGSAIQDGQILSVDWYQFGDVEALHAGTNYCLPQVYTELQENLRRLDEAFGQNQWMWMGFDEWRVAFWDDRCTLMPNATHAGQYMAKAMEYVQDLLWCKNPCREITVWNDMYDPYGNCWIPYGMTNGGTMNAWKGLDSNVIIINWIGKWAPSSYAFYMGLDDSLRPGVVNRQILTADGPVAIQHKIGIAEPLEKKGGRGIIGVCYVNWNADYSQLLPLANACKTLGRWTTGPLPSRTVCRQPATQCTPGIADRSIEKRIAPTTLQATRLGHGLFIRYGVASQSHVKLQAIDLLGRTVDVLLDETKSSGHHQITWKTTNLPAGIYFIRLELDGISHTTRKQIIF